MNWSTPDCPLW